MHWSPPGDGRWTGFRLLSDLATLLPSSVVDRHVETFLMMFSGVIGAIRIPLVLHGKFLTYNICCRRCEVGPQSMRRPVPPGTA